MRNLLLFLDARLGESSTYAGIAALLLAVHVNVAPGTMNLVTLWGVALAGVLAVILKEGGTKPGAAVAQDALAALVAAVKAMPEGGATAAKVLFAALLLPFALAACTPAQTQQTLSVICSGDPVAYAAGQAAGTVISVTMPPSAGLTTAMMTADQALLHPTIVNACKGLGQVPVALPATVPKS